MALVLLAIDGEIIGSLVVVLIFVAVLILALRNDRSGALDDPDRHGRTGMHHPGGGGGGA